MIRNVLRRFYKLLQTSKARVLYICKGRKICKEMLDKELIESTWSRPNISCISDEILKTEIKKDLSIIIPLYNSEQFLDKCIGTFVKQKTKYTYEVILVDDGSTDATRTRAEEFQKKYADKIKLIFRENGGISAARNTGLENSCGRYIGFADHDDWVTTDYVEKLLSAAYSEDADIVKCEFLEVRDRNTVATAKKDDKIINGPLKEELFAYKSYIWGGVYKRKLFERVRFPVGFWYEDMITRALLYRQSDKFIALGETLYYKLQHKNNASNVVWQKQNPKCLEQLYLPEQLASDGCCLNLPRDVYMYECLLHEYSSILKHRIDHMPDKIQKQVFLYARSVLMKNYKGEFQYEMDDKWKKWNNVFVEKRYDAWRALCDL